MYRSSRALLNSTSIRGIDAEPPFGAEEMPELGLREDLAGGVADYDVVLIHGLRDSHKTVWKDEDTLNWVRGQLLRDRRANLLEFRYDISDKALIYSEGIDAEAVRLLEELINIRRTRPFRPLIFVTRDLGGVIAQMALIIASSEPWRYGTVVRLTNLMVFYNCPRQFRNPVDTHDTMVNLLGLTAPGVPTLTSLFMKARILAEQIYMTNHRVSEAMLWQHIPVANIISLPSRNERDNSALAEHKGIRRIGSSGYYIEGISATARQPLEYSFLTRATHVELATIGVDDAEIIHLSEAIKDYIPKGTNQYFIGGDNTGKPTWRYLLSECPPVRSPLLQHIHEKPSDDQFWSWFKEQRDYQSWYEQTGVGTRILHAHGSSLVDVWSDKIYDGVNKSRSWLGTTLHFRFDRNDARFDNVRGMLSYLLVQLCRRFMFAEETRIIDTLVSSLGNPGIWSATDLFQWILILRQFHHANNVLYIISCIDQCKDDIVGYLHRFRDIGKNTELRFRILVTSDANSDFTSKLKGYPNINLDGFVPDEQYSPNGLNYQNQRLFESLSALDRETKSLVKQIIASCGSNLQLSRMLLTWLISIQESHDFGTVEILRNMARPPSALSIGAAIRASLPGDLQAMEKRVFAIVKTALHPLSIDQIAWALISDNAADLAENPGQRQRDAAAKIRRLLPGLYELTHGEIHLHHGYRDYDNTKNEPSHHAMMTRICIGYLSIPQVQENIENFRKTDLDGEIYPAYFGDNLTAYSVKFLASHYRLACEVSPQKEVFNFFENKASRMAWYNAHSILTRHPRASHHIQPVLALPVVAQTGLADLTAIFIESEKGKENFVIDLGIALTEASRHGRSEVVDRLLKEPDIKVGALKNAVSYAASYGTIEPLNTLVNHCALIQDFEWPEDILHHVSWLGLTSVVKTLLEARVTANSPKESQNFPRHSPLTLCMAGRHQEVAELLVQEGESDESPTFALYEAARHANPHIVSLLLERHFKGNDLHVALVRACFGGAFTTVKELLKKIPSIDWESGNRKHIESLTMAVNHGYFECARALVAHGAKTNISDGQTLPLISAVENRRLELARLLLDHGADPNVTTKRFKLPLVAAVENGDMPMVNLLIEKGADIDMQDKTGTISRTALLTASAISNQDILHHLLVKGAYVNLNPIGSCSPLLTAVWNNQVDNVKILLEHGAHINDVASVPLNWAPINAAYDNPTILRILIEGGADINHRSSDGTVLYQASRWGFEATVELLLEYQNILELNRELIDEGNGEDNGMSPLCIACKYNHVGIIRLLLEAGANAQHTTRHGRFPLELCIRFAPRELPNQAVELLLEYYTRIDVRQKDHDSNTALHQIDEWTPLAIIRRLLNAGADLDAVNHRGYTPLMVATEAGNIEVCRYLFGERASSADVKAIGSDLLPLAAHSGSSELIQMMVEAGADVNKTDPRTGETPLYIYLTTRSPNIQVVRYLVNTCKADVNLGVDKYPIIQACKTCDRQIIQFLLESGANVNVEDHAGRRPIHVLYCLNYNDIGVLLNYGADLEARDKLGRTALHYAAALAGEEDIKRLIDSSSIGVNQKDADGWTSLMWACLQRRPWNLNPVIEVLLYRGADIWARGKVEDEEWSPMKLATFYGDYGSEKLEPWDKRKPRHGSYEDEYWDDEFHQSRPGLRWKNAICDGCFCVRVGVRWECKGEHGSEGFNLCFRCYPHRDILHPGHEQRFERLGDRFGPASEGSSGGGEDDVREGDIFSEESE